MNKNPILHDKEFGGQLHDKAWYGKWLFMNNDTWAFVYIDDNGEEDWDTIGRGKTPKDAFNECIQIFKHRYPDSDLNETIRAIMPKLEPYFKEDGQVRVDRLLAL